MNNSPDRRSPLTLAMEWVSRITTISLEMVLPGLLGAWVDQRWNTLPVFLVLGVILGMTTGILHLVRLTASADRPDGSERKPPDND